MTFPVLQDKVTIITGAAMGMDGASGRWVAPFGREQRPHPSTSGNGQARPWREHLEMSGLGREPSPSR